jgi:catechol 2,3-dioxygenase-like lactoylglutathione lyase family enzyme
VRARGVRKGAGGDSALLGLARHRGDTPPTQTLPPLRGKGLNQLVIDHLSLSVADLAASATFYEAVLAPLGYRRLVEREATIGFGKRYPEVWLNHRPGRVPEPEGSGLHICLRARDQATVQAFHAAALVHGGSDDGPPGPRQAAMTGYYAAFIKDLDGNRLEAATFPLEG